MKEKAQKKTIVQRVLEFINGGEEANVEAILRLARKKWNKQIEQKEKLIVKLEEKLIEDISDQNEYIEEDEMSYTEAFLNVDAEVKGRDNVMAYIESSYEQQIANALDSLNRRKDDIAEMKAKTASAVVKLRKEIAQYKSYLVKLK